MLGARRGPSAANRHRWGPRRWLAGAAGVAALSALVAVTPALASGGSHTAGSASPAMVTLSTDVLPGLSAAQPLGPTPAGQTVEVGITLANPNAAAQQAAYQAIYTRGSPEYHHFMTPAQVASQFGVPDATFAQVKSWATRDGLRPVFSPATNEFLLLRGTAAQAEQTFSVAMADYRSGSSTVYANTNGPTVPAGLDIDGVIGLNNKLRMHTFNHAPAAGSPHGTAAVRPAQSTCAGGECVGLTTPQDLWSIYNQPTDITDTAQDFGQGQQMAVFGEGAVSGVLSDLRAFEKEFSLPQIPVTIDSVGDTFKDTSGNGEWDIDMQATTGMSPRAYGETLYFANDLTDASVEGDFAAWANDPNGPNQANASFGECEEDPTSPVTGSGSPLTVPPTLGSLAGPAGTAGIMFTQEAENTLEQANLEGRTLFSSTGDTGSSCPVVAAAVIGAGNGVANQGDPETNYPASSPHVVAVGGTVLYGTDPTLTMLPPQRAQETAWSFTGGGNTFYIPEPAYQKGIALLDNQLCVSMPNGTPYTTPTPCRGIPDVAAQSGDVISNGYAVNMGGVPDSAGAGTSLSSPLWVGMWTRVQAAAPEVNGKYTLGFADPVLYKIGQNTTQDPTAFQDIGAGPPTSPATSDGYYASLPRTAIDPSGWDYVSGLGSPNIIALAGYATGNTTLTPTNNLTPPAPMDCGQPGLVTCGGGPVCTGYGVLWANPSDHAVATDTFMNSDPQLTLEEGLMDVAPTATATVTPTTLQVQLVINNLTETVPPGAYADEWYMTWTYKGTEYLANAELTEPAALSGTGPTFHDGTVTLTGNTHQFNATNTDTGKFTLGPNGVIEIDVPLANVGSPPIGSVLLSPAGETDIEVGTPAGGLLEKVDSGGPGCNYTVGATPPATTSGTGSGGGGGTGSGGSGGSGGSPTTTAPGSAKTVTRLAGPNRIATAVAVSQESFPMSASATSVVLARDDIYPDALAGTALAVAKHAPLLLTEPTGLDPATQAEIQRVLGAGHTVYLLGGSSALSPAVADKVTSLGYSVTRYSGPNRAATAVQVAAAGLGNPATVLLATGLDFPDALTAGAAAGHVAGAVVFSDGAAMDPTTRAYLAAHPGDHVTAVGGPAASADPSATPVVGANRDATGVDVAKKFFSAPTVVGVADDLAFPDALTGGAQVSSLGGPLLLTNPSALAPEVSSYLSANASTLTQAFVYGGTAAISDAVASDVGTAMH